MGSVSVSIVYVMHERRAFEKTRRILMHDSLPWTLLSKVCNDSVSTVLACGLYLIKSRFQMPIKEIQDSICI